MTKQCSSCGGFCGNVCQRENVTQPEPDVDYWIREATAARQAEMALRRELEAQPVQRQPLTEQQQVDCLVKAGCIGTVKMSFESGPYDITRPSINASRLIEAVEAAHGIEGATK